MWLTENSKSYRGLQATNVTQPTCPPPRSGLYFTSDNRGPPLSHSNCCSLRLEPRLVPSLFDHGQGTRWPPWHHSAGCRPHRALLRAPRTLPRFTHGSVSRPLRLALSLRLAP